MDHIKLTTTIFKSYVSPLVAIAIDRTEIEELRQWFLLDTVPKSCSYLIYVKQADETELSELLKFLVSEFQEKSSQKRPSQPGKQFYDSGSFEKENLSKTNFHFKQVTTSSSFQSDFELERGEIALIGGLLCKTFDEFFYHCACSHNQVQAAVQLSQLSSDGYKGLKAIRQKGKVTLQRITNWQSYFDSGERVDFVGTCQVLTKKLDQYLIDLQKHYSESQSVFTAESENALLGIFNALTKKSLVDFTQYQDYLIAKHIQSRMLIHQDQTIDAYAKRIARASQQEIHNLYNNILERFASFSALKTQGVSEVPQINALKQTITQLHEKFVSERLVYESSEYLQNNDIPSCRIWVIGCSTGEEVYSLAILLEQIQKSQGIHYPWKIIATDRHQQSVDMASSGIYSTEDVEGIDGMIIQQYFRPIEEGQWKVVDDIRKNIVFTHHDYTSDQSYTNIDLVCNFVDIDHFKPVIQKKLYRRIAFTLTDNGLLMDRYAHRLDEYFNQLDRYGLYQKKETGIALRYELSQSNIAQAEWFEPQTSRGYKMLSTEVLSWLLSYAVSEYLPAMFVCDDGGNVVLSVGDVGQFIRSYDIDSVAVSSNVDSRALDGKQLYDILLEGLGGIVEEAIQNNSDTRVVLENVCVDNQTYSVKIESRPISNHLLMLVVFNPEFEPVAETTDISEETILSLIEHLEAEKKTSLSLRRQVKRRDDEYEALKERLSGVSTENTSHNQRYNELSLSYQQQKQYLSRVSEQEKQLLHGSGVAFLLLDKFLKVKEYSRSMATLLEGQSIRQGIRISELDCMLEKKKLESLIGNVLHSGKTYSGKMKSDTLSRNNEPIYYQINIQIYYPVVQDFYQWNEQSILLTVVPEALPIDRLQSGVMT